MVLCLFGVLSAHILCLVFCWRIDLSVFSHELFLHLLAARIFYILKLLTFIDFSCNVFAPRMFLTFVLKSLVLFLAWTEWFLLFEMYASVSPYDHRLSLSPSVTALTEARWPSSPL